MDLHLDAEFTIDEWKDDHSDPLVDGDGDGEAPSSGTAILTKTYIGALDGHSTTWVTASQGPRGQAYLAQERIVGSLDGRAGSFVLQHGAVGGEGVETRTWAFVVPGSGTGDLSSIAGEGNVEHGLLHLDVELDG